MVNWHIILRTKSILLFRNFTKTNYYVHKKSQAVRANNILHKKETVTLKFTLYVTGFHLII